MLYAVQNKGITLKLYYIIRTEDLPSFLLYCLSMYFILINVFKCSLILEDPMDEVGKTRQLTTSFPGFSFLFRERTLVAAGRVEICGNKLRSAGRSSTKFCPLNDEQEPIKWSLHLCWDLGIMK